MTSNSDVEAGDTTAELAWSLGLSIFLIPTSLLLITALGFVAHLNVSPLHLGIGVAISGAVLIYRLSKLNLSRLSILAILGGLCLCIIAATAASTLIYNNSWDGLCLHDEYQALLRNGWNPVWEPHRSDSFAIADTQHGTSECAYGYGAEYVASICHAATNSIESAKVIHWLWFFAALCCTFSLIYESLKRIKYALWLAGPASFITAANPTFLTQCFASYVDQDVGSAFLCLLVAVGKLLNCPTRQSAWWMAMLSSIYLICLKLHAAAYAVLTLPVCAIILWLRFRQQKLVMRFTLISATTVIFAFLVVGFFPYGHLLTTLHPNGYLQKIYLFQKDQRLPPYLHQGQLNRLEQLMLSLFSETSNRFCDPIVFDEVRTIASQHPNLRLIPESMLIKENDKHQRLMPPFLVDQQELQIFAATDVRIGGFGPWFGEILAIAIAFFAFTSWRSSFWELTATRAQQTMLILACISLFSSLIHPFAWYARYVPQLWCVPVFLLCSVLAPGKTNRLAAGVFCAVCLLYLGDITMVAASSWRANLADSAVFRSELHEAAIRCKTEGPVSVCYTKLSWTPLSILLRLKEAGVPYQIVTTPPAPADRCYRVMDYPIYVYSPAKNTPVHKSPNGQ